MKAKKLHTYECLHYKIYSFCLGFDIGLGLDAMALALMVLALLTSPQ